jgi:hypothetical protein
MRIRHSGAAAIRKNFEHRLELYRARKPFRTQARPAGLNLSGSAP